MFLYDPVVARAGPIEPFDDGSNKPTPNVLIPARIPHNPCGSEPARDKPENTTGRQTKGYPPIVTKSVKGVYQNHAYMNATPTPKIRSANRQTELTKLQPPRRQLTQPQVARSTRNPKKVA
ncbi:hypothetical protein EMIT0P218_70270 [Pseudomonas sp. IT-P218]